MHNSITPILLVEDNEFDVMAFRRGMKKHAVENPLTVVGNGREALQFLRGETPVASPDRATFIFLDLNMPLMNGFEFLAEVDADDNLTKHPVFVLTTADLDEASLRPFEHLINGQVNKSELGDACLKVEQHVVGQRS